MKNNSHITLPAEWEAQEMVQLTWPHEGTDWNYMLEEVNACFVEIAKTITQYEQLLIVCKNEEKVKSILGDINTSKISFFEIPSDDTWARDHGGITVFENRQRVICDFKFNGWGEKFDANKDNKITSCLFKKNAFGKNTLYRDCLHLILEGGSIESDGKGTLLTTSECLLSANRNNTSKIEIEQELKKQFGLEQVLWLNHGYLAGDDTDSHVDTLARFCNENTIAYVKCLDSDDEHFNALKKMEDELKNFRDLNGNPYNLIPLPMADVVIENQERLPATYANFLIINGAVLLPTYQSHKDKIAEEQLQKAFPDRKIIGIDCTALIKQHGSLHCITMQYPTCK